MFCIRKDAVDNGFPHQKSACSAQEKRCGKFVLHQKNAVHNLFRIEKSAVDCVCCVCTRSVPNTCR